MSESRTSREQGRRTALRVWLAIAEHSPISLAAIARDAQLSERQTLTHLKRFLGRGTIGRKRVKGTWLYYLRRHPRNGGTYEQ